MTEQSEVTVREPNVFLTEEGLHIGKRHLHLSDVAGIRALVEHEAEFWAG
jgi:hypothetical protein